MGIPGIPCIIPGMPIGGAIMPGGPIPGGGMPICIGGRIVCCWENPGGGGGAARAPANCPWYGPWKPGIGGRAPNAIGAGGGRLETGSALFFRAWAANRRSAGVPWRSPLPSFLKAYCTVMALFMRNCPFIDSIAASEDSKSVYDTKP